MQVFKLFHYGTVNEQSIIVKPLSVTGDYKTDALANRSYHDLTVDEEKRHHSQFLLTNNVLIDTFAEYATKPGTRLENLSLEGEPILIEILNDMMASRMTADKPSYKSVIKLINFKLNDIDLQSIKFMVEGDDNRYYSVELRGIGTILISSASDIDYASGNPAVKILANDVTNTIKKVWGL